MTLEKRFLNFLSQQSDVVMIDDLPLAHFPANSNKADALLFDQTVICEVKNLSTDIAPKVNKFIDCLRKRKEWPIVYGEININRILVRFPDKVAIKRKLFELMTASTEDHIEKANKQIRDTRKSLKLSEASGLVVLINDVNDLLSPKLLAQKIGRLFNKREASNRPLESICCVTILSDVHKLNLTSGEVVQPFINVFTDERKIKEVIFNKIEMLQRNWASFNNTEHRTHSKIYSLSEFISRYR